jgi:hypothetical protein
MPMIFEVYHARPPARSIWHGIDDCGILKIMPAKHDPARIPDDRLSIEQRSDGALVVRVRSAGPEGSRLPDAVFSFRCGDPQYAYWLDRLQQRSNPR